jgi:ABC-2 type transport system ATP-binding protein
MILIEHLTKRYGSTSAVSDASFTCRPGTVTGFLGPNGAGKSTTMRMLCGLTAPSSGTATVLGVPFGQLPRPGRQVGVLLDASAQHPGRTGRETLILSTETIGVDRDRVEEVLTMVGLDAVAARRRVGKYSLGMRQRLGVGIALLGNPQVLILDEPANGLDPAGIRWMRELLRHFADRGGTVLLSSHLLGEVQAVADRLVIIADGRIAAQGSTTELLSQTGLHARATDPQALAQALTAAGLPHEHRPGGRFLIDAPAESIARAALAQGVVLLELREPDAGGLEELFLSLTNPAERAA